MHKDPPPTLFDPRRPLSHVVSHGLIAGFAFSVVAHFGWTLWRQNSGAVARPSVSSDAIISGLGPAGAAAATPTPSAAVRYR
ncbi:MAG TPA: hypothetical protein VF551_07105 [Chthoniobacterales bacterium]|jgi:hypothetical protein